MSSPVPTPASEPPGWTGRGFLWASAAAAAFGVLARLHNVEAFPPLHDFDAAGHALNVVELHAGRLPDPRSWSGSHPPLYHALGAALWRILPDAIPVHVTLRLVSVASWVATVAIVWRALRRRVGEVDAAVVAALLLGVPGVVIGTGMMTNDALSALFATAVLARLMGARRDGPPGAGHAAWTGALAGLAVLAKASGFAVVAVAGLWYAWAARRDARAALRNAAAFGGVVAALAAPHYGRLLLTLPGSPVEILIGYAGSEERRAISELLSLPPESFRRQVPFLMHAAVWGDPFQEFMPEGRPQRWLLLGGLLVTGLAAGGALRLALRRSLLRGLGAPLAFAALLAASFLRMLWSYPHPMLLKPSYLLSGALPAGLLLGYGLAGTRGRLRAFARCALLAVGVGGTAVTWYGWWNPAAPPLAGAGVVANEAPRGSALAIVQRYFSDRVDDPIRAQDLVDDELSLARGIRLAWLFDASTPPPGDPSGAQQRSLELARARVAEMELYKLAPWLRPLAASLRVEGLESGEERGVAHVTVRIAAAGEGAPPEAPGAWPFPPFEQRFELRRSPGAGEWRITAIDQREVSDANAAAAFVAHPTRVGLERVSRISAWPGWRRERR